MFITTASISGAANTDYIRLLPPSQTGGLSVMEAFWKRASVREFSAKPLADQDLSDLLFAASGSNRPEEGKITAPSALNTQEIDVYLFTTQGVFKYIPVGHKLEKIVDGDYRKIIAGTPEFSQDFVLDAPVSLLIVANPQKFERSSDMAQMMAVTDAGIMTENVCLFCAGKRLACVPRATMDREAIAKLLNLPKEVISVINIPVGYHK